MASQISFSEIHKKLVDRKKWEKKMQEDLEYSNCKCCNQNLVKNGISQIAGICSTCVSLSIQ